jgi:hypothetical protein
MIDLDADLTDLRTDMKTVLGDLSYLRAKSEHLPTTWVLVTAIATSQAALLGFAVAALKSLSH